MQQDAKFDKTEVTKKVADITLSMEKQKQELNKCFNSLEQDKQSIFAEIQESCDIISKLQDNLPSKSKKYGLESVKDALEEFGEAMEKVEANYEAFKESLDTAEHCSKGFLEENAAKIGSLSNLLCVENKPRTAHKRVVSSCYTSINKVLDRSDNSRQGNKSVEKGKSKIKFISRAKLLNRTKSFLQKEKSLVETPSLTTFAKNIKSTSEEGFFRLVTEIKSTLKKLEDKYIHTTNSSSSVSQSIMKSSKLNDKAKFGIMKASEKLRSKIHKREGSMGNPKHAEIKGKSTMEKQKMRRNFEIEVENIKEMLEKVLSEYKKEFEVSSALRTEVRNLRERVKSAMKSEIKSDLLKMKAEKQENKHLPVKKRNFKTETYSLNLIGEGSILARKLKSLVKENEKMEISLKTLETELSKSKKTVSKYEVENLKQRSALELNEINLAEKENSLVELQKITETLRLEMQNSPQSTVSRGIDKVAFVEFGNLVAKLVEQTGVGVALNKTNLASNDSSIYFSYLGEIFDLVVRCVNSKRMENEKKVSKLLRENKANQEEWSEACDHVETNFKVELTKKEKNSYKLVLMKVINAIRDNAAGQFNQLTKAADLPAATTAELQDWIVSIKKELNQAKIRLANMAEEGKSNSNRSERSLFEINLELKGSLRKAENKVKELESYLNSVSLKAKEIESHWTKFYSELTESKLSLNSDENDGLVCSLGAINIYAQHCCKFYHETYTERKLEEEVKIKTQMKRQFPSFDCPDSKLVVVADKFVKFVSQLMASERAENKELREGIEDLFEKEKSDKVKQVFTAEQSKKAKEFSFKDKLVEESSSDKIPIQFENESFGNTQLARKIEEKQQLEIDMANLKNQLEKKQLELSKLVEEKRMAAIEAEVTLNDVEETVKSHMVSLVKETKFSNKGKEIVKLILRMLKSSDLEIDKLLKETRKSFLGKIF